MPTSQLARLEVAIVYQMAASSVSTATLSQTTKTPVTLAASSVSVDSLVVVLNNTVVLAATSNSSASIIDTTSNPVVMSAVSNSTTAVSTNNNINTTLTAISNSSAALNETTSTPIIVAAASTSTASVTDTSSLKTSGAATSVSSASVFTAYPSAMLSRLEVAITAATSPSTYLSRLEVFTTVSPASGQMSRLEAFLNTASSSQLSRLSVDSGTVQAIIQSITGNPAARSLVVLDGSNSTGSPTQFFWQQISGTPVTILNQNVAISGFKAPALVTGDTLVFQLTASRSQISSTAQITINISPQITWTASGSWIPSEWNRLVIAPLNEMWDGVNNSPWSSQWTITGTGSAYILNNLGVLAPGIGAFTSAIEIAYLQEMSPLTDYQLSTDIGFDGGNVQQYVVVGMSPNSLNISGQTVPQNGYSVQFFPASGGFNVNRSVSSTSTSLSGNVPYTYTAGNRVSLLIIKNGTNLTVWVWDLGTPMPTAPSWSGVDYAPYTGSGNVYLATSNGSATTPRISTFNNLTVQKYSPLIDPNAMPIGDLSGGWQQVSAEDFNTSFPVNTLITNDSLNSKIISTDAASLYYKDKIRLYQAGHSDSNGVGVFDPARFSAASSVLTLNAAVIGGVATGGHFHPVVAGQTGDTGVWELPTGGGRYKVRARFNATDPHWTAMTFFKSLTNTEMDWSSGPASSPNVQGTHYFASAGNNPIPAVGGIVRQDWHTYEVIYIPGTSVQYLVDGVVASTQTVDVGSARVSFGFAVSATSGLYPQTTLYPNAALLPGTGGPANGSTATIEIDWVCVYEYNATNASGTYTSQYTDGYL